MHARYYIAFVILLLNHCYGQEVAPGVWYTHEQNILNQSIHLLRVDPHQVDIEVGVANNSCSAQAATVSQIALQKNAIAAINGGFFDFGSRNTIEDIIIKILDSFFNYSHYTAYPVYTLYCNKHYYAVSSVWTGALCWNNADNHPQFGIIKTDIVVTIHHTRYPVAALNKPQVQEPALYSRGYGACTPVLYKRADELIIVDGQVKKIYTKSSGAIKIPENGWVYVIPRGYSALTDQIHIGDFVSIEMVPVEHDDTRGHIAWHEKDTILASTPLLIHNSTIVPALFAMNRSFYTSRYPRTCVGVMPDRTWIFVVVDGRHKHRKGFTLLELAEYMKSLGCTDALNLDGGSSSTMVIHHKVVSNPSGRSYSPFAKETRVSHALLITKKKE